MIGLIHTTIPIPRIGGQYGTIGCTSPNALADFLMPLSASNATASWIAANRAIFMPFEVTIPLVATQLAWLNGATASGNVDAGIYSPYSGARLISTGSTAQSGTSVWQVVDITDTPLMPGIYYMALAMDGTTGTSSRINAASPQYQNAFGMAQMASAFPLPSTATFADTVNSYVPLMLVALRSVV